MINSLARWPLEGCDTSLALCRSVLQQVLCVRECFYIATELLALATQIQGRPFDLLSKHTHSSQTVSRPGLPISRRGTGSSTASALPFNLGRLSRP